MKQLHPVFNIVKLTLALDDLITGRKTEDHLPPIVIDGEAEWCKGTSGVVLSQC